MKSLCPVLVSLCLATALPAGQALAANGGGGDQLTISLSLTKYAGVERVEAGSAVGVRPAVIHARVGDRIVFVNDDTDHHTATSLLNAAAFVEDPRWTDDALRQTGQIGAGFWSTGDLAPGQRSAPILVTKPGTYLYGCFFDYGAGMRGEIVVEP